MISEFEALGCYLVKPEERKQLEEYMWQVNKKGYRSINPGIVAKSAVAIAEALETNTPLQSLSLSRMNFPNLTVNKIGDKGAKALGEALRTNNTLHTLYLDGKRC